LAAAITRARRSQGLSGLPLRPDSLTDAPFLCRWPCGCWCTRGAARSPPFQSPALRRPEWVLRGLAVSRDALTVDRAVCAGERRSV